MAKVIFWILSAVCSVTMYTGGIDATTWQWWVVILSIGVVWDCGRAYDSKR